MRTLFASSLFLLVSLILFLFVSTGSMTRVSAFFHLDQEAFGTPTKTILSDGRIHYKYNEIKNGKFPTTGFAKNLPQYDEKNFPSHLTKPYFNLKAEVVLRPHWKIFDISEHTDTDQLICHEYGDINLRVSLFGASAELSAALKSAPQHVVLHADANKVKCHGFPFFRRVVKVHSFDNELLLITHRANYEHIFDEADVHVELSHPNLTHMEGDSVTGFTRGAMHFDGDARDAGVHEFESVTTTASYGSTVVPRASKTTMDKEQFTKTKLSDHLKKVMEDEEQQEMQQQQQESDELEDVRARKGRRLGWFKKVRKGFKKVVKKAKKTVRKYAKKVVKKSPSWVKKGISFVKSKVKSVSRSISNSVSGLLRNIGSTFTSAYNAVANALTINLNLYKRKSMSFPLSKSRKLGVATVTGRVTFTTTMYFKLRIIRNKLQQIHMSVAGSLDASGGAGFNIRAKMSDEAQTNLFEIKGPRISFMISILPVWIDTSLPVAAGFEFDFDFKASAQAGFGIRAYARAGVEYNRGKGFTQIAERNYGTTKYLKYTASIDANVMPFVNVMVRFGLYSFVAGYGIVTFGLNNHIYNAYGNSPCDLKIDADFVIRFSASLAIEIAIGSIDIYEYNFGTVQLFSKSIPAYKACLDISKIASSLLKYGSAYKSQQNEGLLPSSSENADVTLVDENDNNAPPSLVAQQRLASALNTDDGDDSATRAQPEESGRTWTTSIDCPVKAPKSSSQSFYDNELELSVQGHFLDNFTLLFISVSRNISWTDGNSSLVTQSSFFWFENNFTIGLQIRAYYVEASDTGFEELGLDLATVENMEGFATGSESFEPINLTWVDISISNTSLDEITVSNPLFCADNAKTHQPASSTNEPEQPPPNSDMAKQLRSLDQKVGEAFIRLVTDSIIIVLILAFFEVIFAWQSPKIMGQYYPTTTSKPSGREKVGVVSATVLASFCLIIFLSGMTRDWSQIVGIRVETNYSSSERPSAFSPPPPSENDGSESGQPRSSLLKAAGLEAVIFTFAGANVKRSIAPQYAPCWPSKICLDLAETKTFAWSSTPWPVCPGSTITQGAEYTGHCFQEASDVYSHVTFLCLFFLGIIPPIFFFSCVYRRLPISHACLMMVGLNLSLLWHRVDSFMNEILADNFEPAASMVEPYRLFLDNDSQWLMRMGAILLFVLIGLYALYIVFECYSASKEELERRHFHQDFEGKNAAAELVDIEAAASVSGNTNNNNNNTTDNKTSSEEDGNHDKAQPFLL